MLFPSLDISSHSSHTALPLAAPNTTKLRCTQPPAELSLQSGAGALDDASSAKAVSSAAKPYKSHKKGGGVVSGGRPRRPPSGYQLYMVSLLCVSRSLACVFPLYTVCTQRSPRHFQCMGYPSCCLYEPPPSAHSLSTFPLVISTRVFNSFLCLDFARHSRTCDRRYRGSTAESALGT